MPFQTLVQSWHDFYTLTGAAAATLVGLLFVGLSLHLRTVVSRREVRSLARVTLSNFALLLIVALFMVIPQGPSNASAELILSGALSLAIIVPSVFTGVTSSTRTLRLRQLVMRFGLSVLGASGVVLAGVFVGQGYAQTALTTLVAVTVMLFVVSLRNTWDLLVSVAEVTLPEDSTGA